MPTENRLYSRAEIRWELYILGINILISRNSHLVRFGAAHPDPCDICKRIRGEVIGLNSAIRHFGGRIQLSVTGERR